MLAADLAPAAAVICLGLSTTPQAVALSVGDVYELRASADVLVRAGSGLPTASDLRVRPDSPLVFRADVGSLSCLAATGSDAVVTLRRVRGCCCGR